MTELNFSLNLKNFAKHGERNVMAFIIFVLSLLSIFSFIYFYQNNLGLSYNDARSHLDIGRRVVEGLKPGLAQIGSVWLPLNHLLMVPTIWNDFMWHSGLAGAIQSMIAFVATGLLVYLTLRKLGATIWAGLFGVLVFAANINVLYLQSTAMTELILLGTMTAGVYSLICWAKEDKIIDLVKSAFWIMLSTLVRYDGWFLVIFVTGIILVRSFFRKGYRQTEGTVVLFATLGLLGIFGWIAWNQLIFKDALYFILGPFSAHAQQEQLNQAGVLATKGNLLLSLKTYIYALFYNSNTFITLLGLVGAVVLWFDKKILPDVRFATSALFAPFLFNVIALFLGFSVLYVQGVFGTSWFNVRYGVMLMPTIAIFCGFLFEKLRNLRWVLFICVVFVSVFTFTSFDAVTIDDATVGSSHKNVTEVSSYLNSHAKNEAGFILISAASHDAIIFSSGLPMKKFIHEGTGTYWTAATSSPDRWAKWIVMRTYDDNDLTYKSVRKSPGLKKYYLVAKYPFADVYELDSVWFSQLNISPTLGPQR